MIATTLGLADVVKTLLQKGANTTFIDRNEKTALDYALMNKKGFEIFRLFLDYEEFDMNTTDLYGQSLFRKAIQGGNYDIVSSLIKQGISYEKMELTWIQRSN